MIRIVRTHKFKRTTNSNHNHNIAPDTFWMEIFRPRDQTRNGPVISPLSLDRQRAGCILR